MIDDDLAPAARFEVEAGDAPAPALADYCAACGLKAPPPQDAGERALELQSCGWLCLQSRNLHPHQRNGSSWRAPHNCLCPACLSAPTPFTLQLLRAWGWPFGEPRSDSGEASRRASWRQSRT